MSWIKQTLQRVGGWWHDLSFRTATGTVGAVRYQPRRLVLTGGPRLAGLPGDAAPHAMSRASRELDEWMDGVALRTGERLGPNAETWFRWVTEAAGGLIDNVGASALDDLPFRRALQPSMLKPHVHPVGVLVLDMRGFSRLTVEVRDTQDLTRHIEEYLAEMTRVVELHHGVVFQYTGDGLLALFLPELTRKEPSGVVEQMAGSLSLDLQIAFDDLHGRWRMEWEEQEFRPPSIGLAAGACWGEGTIGLMGPSGRKYFGIVGPPVNLASFLCSKAEAGTTLVDEASFLQTGALRPEFSRRVRVASEKLHQRISTVEVRPLSSRGR